jgi:hypothetical protein
VNLQQTDLDKWLRDNPDLARRNGLLKESPTISTPTMSKPKPPLEQKRAMNKAETFYSYELERLKQHGEIKSWKYEGLKLRLAEKTTYTPDFLVWMKNGDICLYEVKGFWKNKGKPHFEDEARVKLKVAAELFPEFAVWAVWFDGSQFQYEYFGSRRINHAAAEGVKVRVGITTDL